MASFGNSAGVGRDPPIPSYDEAIGQGNGNGYSSYAAAPLVSPYSNDPLSPMGEGYDAAGHQSPLLMHGTHRRSPSTSAPANGQSQSRPGGYRPPTVETDDEESLWSSNDSESGHGHGDLDMEAAHVRREMQELEIEDPLDDAHGQRGRASIFGKTIGFTISLPRWRWNWRLPRLGGLRHSGDGGGQFSRLAGTAPEDETSAEANENGDSATTTTTQTRRRRCRPSWNKPSGTFALVVMARMIGLLVVLGFVYLLFMSDLFKNLSRRLGSQVFDPASVRTHIQESVDPARMREYSKEFTSYAHMAGTEGDYALAIDTKKLFESFSLEDVRVDEYYAYLNYPTKDGRSVSIVDKDGKATWVAKLEEEEVGGETAGHQTYVFHGLSKAGDVKGPLVYANYGSRQDYQKLQEMGINTTGAIALVRNHGSQKSPALKVKAAELAGFAGCLLYSDPKDSGFLVGEVAPNGRYLPADGVQRASMGLTGWTFGDVLTPGWESKHGMPRMDPKDSTALVQIPSLPLAWRDAQVLLQHLKGAGVRVPDDEWTGGVPDVAEWWTGNATDTSPIVHLRNEQDEIVDKPVWNVYGRIVGIEESAKTVLLGNHRDAWAFGASGPHSGTAVMLEVARIFGDLLDRGWRPLRTIEFMSWDASAYNLVGSTEYVEKNLDFLRSDCLAYINLDTAVGGGGSSKDLHAAGSPMFVHLLEQVMKRVGDPTTNSSMFDRWQERHGVLELLGADTDAVPFQHLAGTSSLDLHFGTSSNNNNNNNDNGRGGSALLHTSYDNFAWMDHVGDPGYVYHGMLAQVVGLMLIELCDRPILPLDMTTYAAALVNWTKDLIALLHNAEADSNGGSNTRLIDTDGLWTATETVIQAAQKFIAWERSWETQVMAAKGWEPVGLGNQRAEYNDRMATFETDLLDLSVGGGIPNRPQYKHVLFGPRLWSTSDGELFPAIRDAVEAGNWALANATVARTAEIFKVAAKHLVSSHD